MAINIQPDRHGNDVANVTCNSCGIQVDVDLHHGKNNRDRSKDTGHINKLLQNKGWHVRSNKHFCAECMTKSTQRQVEDTKSTQRLVDGKTSTGIDVFIDGDPVFLPLMAAEIGGGRVADEIGVAVSTISHILRHGSSGGRGTTGVRKVYEVAAEALALRAEMAAKNEMLDRAQHRANMAEQELTKANKRVEDAEHMLRQADATIDDLRKTQTDAFDDEAEEKRWAYVQGAMDAHDGVVTVEQLRATIKAFFNRDVFDLTPDDLALMNMTLRDVVKGG